MMKRKVRSIVWLGVFASLWATTADAQLLRRTPEKLDGRIDKMKVFFEELQGSGSKIPKAILQKAQGLIVMRQIKVGVGVGAQVGAGVATVRDPASGQWSVPAFVNNMEGSYGLQIGGQKSDTVILLMNDEGMEVLRRGGLRFGVDVRATAGPVSGGADLKMEARQSKRLALRGERNTQRPIQRLATRHSHIQTFQAVRDSHTQLVYPR
ncbi:MAG: lipid-binding SYLF domain-containing protein [Verrucomicrobiota bacterium]